MRIFVTGASGFIGSHLIPVLLEAGCEVAILSRPGNSLWRLQKHIKDLKIFYGDFLHTDSFSQQLMDFRPEACIHLAWYVDPSTYLYSDQNIPYLFNSIQLLKLLIKNGCEQVVMAGTCAEYDTSIGYLQETSLTKPSTIYAASKLSLSILGQQIAKDAGVAFAWARLFYLYGDTENEKRLVPSAINALLRNEIFPATAGEQIRDYLHVTDVASAFWFVLQNRLSGVYNVSSGEPISIQTLLRSIGDILEKKKLIQFGAIPYREWEPMFICGDNSKLKKLGWRPGIHLEAGLKETIAWWQTK